MNIANCAAFSFIVAQVPLHSGLIGSNAYTRLLWPLHCHYRGQLHPPQVYEPITALVHKQVIGLDTQASLKEPPLNQLQSEASIAAGEEE